MNISILDNNASQTYINYHNILLKQWDKKVLKSIFISIAAGLCSLTYSIITKDDLGYGICIVVFSFAIGRFRHRFNLKNDLIARLHKNTINHFGRSNTINLIISDESVKYEGDALKQDIKWTIITSFMIIENYLFLLQDEGVTSVIVIDRKLISDSDYNELLNYVQKNKTRSNDLRLP